LARPVAIATFLLTLLAGVAVVSGGHAEPIQTTEPIAGHAPEDAWTPDAIASAIERVLWASALVITYVLGQFRGRSVERKHHDGGRSDDS